MRDAADIYGNVFKNGSVTLMARVLGLNAVALTQSDFSTSSSSSGVCDWPARYSIWLIDEDDPDSRTEITGHYDKPLTVADIIFNALQTDARWTVDDTGYNFRHTVEICDDYAFTIAGREYLVEYTLTPSNGQPLKVRFRLACK